MGWESKKAVEVSRRNKVITDPRFNTKASRFSTSSAKKECKKQNIEKGEYAKSKPEPALGEDEGDDDYTSTDTDEEDEAYGLQWRQSEEKVAELDKATHRLAVVNLDWDQVQAVDLFVEMSPFVPKTGQICSVSVYPSELRLERMKEEAAGFFFDDDDKLRPERSWHYFAVVVCDSTATADHLYCINFEWLSDRLDLSFIPDSMEFNKHLARDVATKAPANYETRALQHRKAHPTWDEIESGRSRKLKRKCNLHQVKKLKLKVNLHQGSEYATSESETDDCIDTAAYLPLLLSGDNSDDDNRMEMEVPLEDPSRYDDPRFSSLFRTEHALDPTHPHFKRSAAYMRQLARNQHNEQPSEEGNSSRRQENL